MSKDKTKQTEEETATNKPEEAVEEQGQKEQEKAQEAPVEKQGEESSETASLKEELNKEKNKYMRLFAEFENYKRRTGREHLDLRKTASQEVMSAMLPILDDFDRAVKEIQKSEERDHFEGIELIYSKFQDTLQKLGLKPMKVKQGDKFDADLHEAVTQIPAPKKKLKGKIVDVVEKGYTLGDKIIRFPKVVIGK